MAQFSSIQDTLDGAQVSVMGVIGGGDVGAAVVGP
jgi:hypothetical protein